MKIALAQINPTVGDLSGNRHKIVAFSRRAADAGAELVIFPELCVTGYPPLDLLNNQVFLKRVSIAIDQICADVPTHLGVLIGAPTARTSRTGKKLINSALLIENGKISGTVGKRLLPSYDVFDEYRYFEPAQSQPVLTFRGLRLGVHICEDMWNVEDYGTYHVYDSDPLADLYDAGIDLFVNVSASPFSYGKHDLRNRILKEIGERFDTPFLLVNQVGANTEVVFDGDSRVHDKTGDLVLCAPSFEESLLIWDSRSKGITVPTPKPESSPENRDISDIHDALVMGIRDYFRKTGAFSKVLIGLSGGIDSAVTCALAVEALGSNKVVGVTLPSLYSSSGSVDDSVALAGNLQIVCHSISIRPAVDAFSKMLDDVFENSVSGLTEENIQARTRGVVLMALSNKFGYLLLTTGNKSELSMGYATLYGDMSGGLAVLSDVFKMQVYELARYINERKPVPVIPENSITKPPSAELAPDQKDEDSLPPYPVLDEILRRYIERGEDVEAIVNGTGFDSGLVRDILSTVDRNEYKRRQAPPGLRVSGKAFGIGRRLPIVQQFQRADKDIEQEEVTDD